MKKLLSSAFTALSIILVFSSKDTSVSAAGVKSIESHSHQFNSSYYQYLQEEYTQALRGEDIVRQEELINEVSELLDDYIEGTMGENIGTRQPAYSYSDYFSSSNWTIKNSGERALSIYPARSLASGEFEAGEGSWSILHNRHSGSSC